MPQQFPFTRGASVDLSPGQRLPSAAFNAADKNAAQAADGLLWSDVAIAKNFLPKTAVSNCGQVTIWDAYLRRWISFGATSSNPAALVSVDGRDDWAALTISAGTNWFATFSAASNGIGGVIVGGGGGAASATKIRQSFDGGVTWNIRSTTASSTESVACLGAVTGGAFVAGLSAASTSNVETSPDGVAWTQRTTLPNSDPRGAIASNGTVIAIVSSANRSSCIYSSNGGITWLAAALPSAKVWAALAWNSRSGKFMTVATDGSIATSLDGITWTAGASAGSFTSGPICLCVLGRLWIASGALISSYVIRVSADDGVTWNTVKSIASATTPASLSTGDNQILYSDAGGYAYSTIRGGL